MTIPAWVPGIGSAKMNDVEQYVDKAPGVALDDARGAGDADGALQGLSNDSKGVDAYHITEVMYLNSLDFQINLRV